MEGAFHIDPKALQFYQMPQKRPKALQGFLFGFESMEDLFVS
jgi:hypothetical protein